MSVTSSIIRQIEGLGYRVAVLRGGGVAEVRATPWHGYGPPHVGQCRDGDGDDELYRAACLLAEGVGIDLEDG